MQAVFLIAASGMYHHWAFICLRVQGVLMCAMMSVAGEKHRGWAVAEAKGLFLERVDYPPHSVQLSVCDSIGE